MIFSRRNRSNQQQPRNMNFASYPIYPISTFKNANNTPSPSAESNVVKPSKMPWGKPTWFMLHTLAEKIKPEHFQQLRVEIFNIIKRICNNLPCPDCTTHATNYINGINFDNIHTKEQLKIMLFQFHNSVNKNKNVPLFDYKDLDSTYKSAVTTNIITNFFHFFLKQSYSGRMGTDNFHRTRMVQDVKRWFQTNIQYFDK